MSLHPEFIDAQKRSIFDDGEMQAIGNRAIMFALSLSGPRQISRGLAGVVTQDMMRVQKEMEGLGIEPDFRKDKELVEGEVVDDKDDKKE